MNRTHGPQGCTAEFRAWTKRDDEAVRTRYRRGAVAGLAADLDRTQKAIRKRAQALGVSAGRHWSAREDAEIRKLWGLFTTRQLGLHLGRTPAAIYNRARVIGAVKIGTDGLEDLSAAARRVGYTRQQLLPILKWAGVAREATSRCLSKYKLRAKYLLDPFEVDEAVAEWVKREAVGVAARRRGLDDRQLRSALRRIGVTRPANLKKRRQWRIDDETVERALAVASARPGAGATYPGVPL